MKALDILVVDDEEAAREVLSSLISKSGTGISSIRTAKNLMEAVDEINKACPDVAFLDINMPNYAGYEIGKFFEEIPCELIFVTAYDKYAIKAFELSAVDYLVKPLERARLNEALDKLQSRISLKEMKKSYQVLLDSMNSKKLDKIVVSELTEGQIKKHVLPLNEIVALKANGAYTEIYLLDTTSILVSKNIKNMGERLPENDSFMRTHRSWIINLDHVTAYHASSGDVSMKAEVVAKVSKTARELFEVRNSIDS
jgi:two-component system LytT family response regulator